jgi:hypothetical protein
MLAYFVLARSGCGVHNCAPSQVCRSPLHQPVATELCGCVRCMPLISPFFKCAILRKHFLCPFLKIHFLPASEKLLLFVCISGQGRGLFRVVLGGIGWSRVVQLSAGCEILSAKSCPLAPLTPTPAHTDSDVTCSGAASSTFDPIRRQHSGIQHSRIQLIGMQLIGMK